ncbi:hypothetical protein E1B28_013060 [Marasmius oreades]|uniref:Uncharacterized protein n=1 Tax=Marasmius oreades TaxID=181124 RepID=A0A9P7UM92_9AGAR|nr:uncharacterized protein E1B28_013060 [Marasmius oreades]KAG7087078.1 hypothetical protein E1B28_013060 [Marasmius oreades]
MKKSDWMYSKTDFHSHLLNTLTSTFMPQPQKYFTAQEKNEANRQKHARYYAKHKAEIQLKRTERTQMQREAQSGKRLRKGSWSKDNKAQCPPPAASSQKGRKKVLPEQPIVLAVQKWEGKAQDLYAKVQSLYGKHKSFHEYCDYLCRKYIAGHDEGKGNNSTHLFEEAHQVMEEYLHQFRHYKQKLLEEVGQEDAYYRVNEMETQAHLAVQALCDLYCEAIIGVEHLSRHYNEGRFSFSK